MNTQVATKADPTPRARRSARALAVLTLGPVVVLAGLVWTLLQPYRITLLDPAGQGFWWLLSEPPLYVIGAGVIFHLAIAQSVAADLDDGEERR